MSLIEEALRKARREGEPPPLRPWGGEGGRGRGKGKLVALVALLFLAVAGAYLALEYWGSLPVRKEEAAVTAHQGEVTATTHQRGEESPGPPFAERELTAPEGEERQMAAVPTEVPLAEGGKPPPPQEPPPVEEGPKAKKEGPAIGKTPIRGEEVRPPAKSPPARDLLAEAFRAAERGELGQALKLYTVLLEGDPSCFEALLNRGVVLAKMGDLDGARRDLEEALRLRPSDPSALNALGVVMMKGGETSRAEELFLRAGDSMAMVNLALLRWRQGRAQEVLALLERAEELDPHNPYPYYYRGLFLRALGKKEEALESIEKAYGLARDRGEVELLSRLEALRSPP